MTGGFIYVGRRSSVFNHHRTEPSLIDETLKVYTRPVTYSDHTLSYWPSYSRISPYCRGAFLSWLGSDRNHPNTPLGYVFIYFYGLERRIMIDSVQHKNEVDDNEYVAIFNEVLRLQQIYGESLSFLRYSTNLLEAMYILRPHAVPYSEITTERGWDSSVVKYQLGKTVSEKKPVSADLALAWLKSYPEYNLRVPARRCAVEFEELFKRRFTQKYAEGFFVKPIKNRLYLSYFPASSAIESIPLVNEYLSDPSMLRVPISKIIAIADECIDDLDSYSRYIGRENNSRSDIRALLLLPEDLKDHAQENGLSQIREWVEGKMKDQQAVVDVIDLWNHTQLPVPEKLNRTETNLLEDLFEKCGYGLVPNREYHFAKPDMDGKYVLFQGGHGTNFKPSKAFHEMGMALRLGAMVATIDSEVDESEVSFLNQLIDHDSSLTSTEKISLRSYLNWRLHTPSNLRGLKARVKKLGPQEKSFISHIMVRVALADGKVERSEILKLERLYSLLGLDKSLVSRDIHHLYSSPSATQSSVINGKPEPSQSAMKQKQKSDTFGLDESILEIHKSQTRDVQSMLSAIFSGEDPEEEMDENYEEDSIDTEAPGMDGIDRTHYALYEKLINKNMWTDDEFDKLCEEKKLMRSGAIETINDWAYDHVGAPVLEEEPDGIYVDHEVVLELDQY